jgi:HTH-type transcriptional regulator/antitoxin HigA
VVLRGNLSLSDSELGDFLEVLANAQRLALRSQIGELAEEVLFYEELSAGKISAFSAEILIQARVARGMSQKELGDFLGVAEQQVQRYGSDRYRTASLDRLTEVADAFSVRIVERAH